MPRSQYDPVISKVLDEQRQGHETRRKIFVELEKKLQKPVISFFTSFVYPVMIEDQDVDMLEGLLQKMDLSNGLAVVISSPGGSGLAAERIINICRSYSETNEFTVIVPNKAKSAATMVCFGAKEIIMSPTSELGPIDPQLTMEIDGEEKRFSVYNIVESYEDLFKKAIKEKGNLAPYLQQLSNYDARDIKEMQSAMALAEDIAIKTLASGMMKGKSEKRIKKDIKIFLTPEKTKTHSRPISPKEAEGSGLNIKHEELKSDIWKLVYELYVRTNNFVSTHVLKCVENKDNSFVIGGEVPKLKK